MDERWRLVFFQDSVPLPVVCHGTVFTRVRAVSLKCLEANQRPLMCVLEHFKTLGTYPKARRALSLSHMLVIIRNTFSCFEQSVLCF